MNNMIDKRYCMNSFLMLREIYDDTKWFSEEYPCHNIDLSLVNVPITNAKVLLNHLERIVNESCADGKAVLALSGGIDSAILAKFVPKGTRAYTFHCVVPGIKVTDETEQARHWAELCGLKHEIVDILWKDVEKSSEILMKHKGAPIHSIECQIYLASLMAKKGGAEKFIFGESADAAFGGMNGLLKKDWTYAQFVERYTYIMPYKVLKDAQLVLEPFLKFEKDGKIDGHEFTSNVFRRESLGSYYNACEAAGVEYIGPFSQTYLAEPIDYQRIRSGETKYIVREAFRMLYPNEILPQKIPMPRPTEQWFKEWDGPQRHEFIPGCTEGLSGDQRWMVYALERFLNLIDEQEEQ